MKQLNLEVKKASPPVPLSQGLRENGEPVEYFERGLGGEAERTNY